MHIDTAGRNGWWNEVSRGADTEGAALERRRLRGVIPASPAELADRSEGGTRLILGKVRKALRAERRRGQAGHWSYDLNRHLALVQALGMENRRLQSFERAGCASPPREQRVSEKGSAPAGAPGE